MQYLVHTSGEVTNQHSKTYTVKASSRDEAEVIGKSNFAEEFGAEKACIYAKPFRRTQKAVVALGFMAIPIIFSFIGWKDGHNTISIQPDAISCLFAIALYAAFVVRFKGISTTIGSWIDIAFAIAGIFLLASFIKIILFTKEINFLWWEIPIDTNIIVVIAIILSWLGLKFVSVICLACVCALAVFNITALNEAMGFNGAIYVVCAFVGILIYLSIEPAVIDSLPYFRKQVGYGLKYIRNDYIEAKSSSVRMSTKIMNKVVEQKSQKDNLNNE